MLDNREKRKIDSPRVGTLKRTIKQANFWQEKRVKRKIQRHRGRCTKGDVIRDTTGIEVFHGKTMQFYTDTLGNLHKIDYFLDKHTYRN